jgi:hypothetical protein
VGSWWINASAIAFAREGGRGLRYAAVGGTSSIYIYAPERGQDRDGRDLQVLAASRKDTPNACYTDPVKDLIRNVRLHVHDVNSMMRDRQLTGDSHLDAACRWLRSNPPSWETWLPDKTNCFPGFGLYDINLQGFVPCRDNPTYVECRACESGTFLSQLDDASGFAYVYTPSPPGTS